MRLCNAQISDFSLMSDLIGLFPVSPFALQIFLDSFPFGIEQTLHVEEKRKQCNTKMYAK
eukprot:scaffold46147_cov53-Attheya_sp.AAC.7